MSILTGHPSVHVGFAQSRHLFASLCAISSVIPWFTSSFRCAILYSGESSGISTLSIAMRSFGFMLLRSSLRHSASLSLSCSRVSVVKAAVASAPWVCALAPQLHSAVSGLHRCSSKCSISSLSAALNVPILLNISSQSTSAPSNSGPSMHTNFVFPPIVSRHAPHIPVPSTMIVLSDTSVGILYFPVSRQQNFIIIGGPMATTLSMCSWLMNFSIPMVTTPFSPYDPSSVITITSSLYSLTSSSSMMRSLFLPAITERILFPAFLSAFMMGSRGAVPTPPPAHTTVPKFCMCVGLPSGPTTSST